MNEPVAYGMLTFCKNCGEQNPYQYRELTDEEKQMILDIWAKLQPHLFVKAQEK